MKVCALVDFMGTSLESPEEEYAQIKKEIEKCTKRKITIYKTDIFPHQLQNENTDIYVMDYGGLLPGCEDTILSNFRELVRASRG